MDEKSWIETLEDVASQIEATSGTSEFQNASVLNIREAVKFLKEHLKDHPATVEPPKTAEAPLAPKKRPVGRPRKVLQEVG